jgi:hypothetical protein
MHIFCLDSIPNNNNQKTRVSERGGGRERESVLYFVHATVRYNRLHAEHSNIIVQAIHRRTSSITL